MSIDLDVYVSPYKPVVNTLPLWRSSQQATSPSSSVSLLAGNREAAFRGASDGAESEIRPVVVGQSDTPSTRIALVFRRRRQRAAWPAYSGNGEPTC
jgi:hypothetical protein